jgi:rifampin ADP-ribosylating transferase
VSDVRRPVTLEDHAHVSGPFFHGTGAVLAPGDELVAGFASHFRPERVLRHIYFAGLVETAVWGAELATALRGSQGLSQGRGHVYEVEPTGAFEDDPNVTNKKFPGNPTESYRSLLPLRVVREVPDWQGHPPEVLAQMLENLQRLRTEGRDVIID